MYQDHVHEYLLSMESLVNPNALYQTFLMFCILLAKIRESHCVPFSIAYCGQHENVLDFVTNNCSANRLIMCDPLPPADELTCEGTDAASAAAVSSSSAASAAVPNESSAPSSRPALPVGHVYFCQETIKHLTNYCNNGPIG